MSAESATGEAPMSGSSVAGVGASDAAAGPRDRHERPVAVVDPVDEAGSAEPLDV